METDEHGTEAAPGPQCRGFWLFGSDVKTQSVEM